MENPISQLHAALSRAEYLNGIYLSDVLSSTRSQSPSEENMDQAEDRLKKLEALVMEFEQSIQFMADKSFLELLKQNNLMSQAQEIAQKIETINGSLLDAVMREQHHLASEIRQERLSSKALDAYRR